MAARLMNDRCFDRKGGHRAPPLQLCLRHGKLLRRYTIASQATCEPVYRTSNQKIRNYREQNRNQDQLERINPPHDDQLIDNVDDDGEDENASDRFPSFVQKIGPLAWIYKNGPEIRWPAHLRIFQSGTDGQ